MRETSDELSLSIVLRRPERRRVPRRLPRGRPQGGGGQRQRSAREPARAVGVAPGLGARSQRSAVKVAYLPAGNRGAWRAHGAYLAREGAQREGANGLGFDAVREDLDVAGTLGAWQAAGDRVLWKAIVSPDQAARLDLRAHARSLLAAMERDLGTRLAWVGIDHHNTDNPHLHLLIRGRDARGRPLALDAQYVQRGIRARSEDLATRVLGWRTDREIAAGCERAVDGARFTDLDRAILARADGKGRVACGDRPPADGAARAQQHLERRRLDFLGRLGLAECVGSGLWQLSPQLEPTLRQLQLAGDIQKSRARHRIPLPDLRGSLVVTRLPLARGGLPERPTERPGRVLEPSTVPSLESLRQEQGRSIRVVPPLDGLIYRGQLLGYARDPHGHHYAVVDIGRELAAFPTEERTLAAGRDVRVTGHAVAAGPGVHIWRLRGPEPAREQERAR